MGLINMLPLVFEEDFQLLSRLNESYDKNNSKQSE